jgi:hypothetical protein
MAVGVIVGSIMRGVADAVGTATRVSVKDEAYVATASVRSASTSTSSVCGLFVTHEKSKTPKIKSIAMEMILVFMLKVYNNTVGNSV